jgi:outer membrane protein OmpA-like peptidoglycan-associated protein
MKRFLVFAIALLPVDAAAGSLVPLTEDNGLSGRALGVALEGESTSPGLSADRQTLGLQGDVPASPLTGLGIAEGLDGQGQGSSLTGFVAALPPPPPEPKAEPPSEPEDPPPPPPEPTRFELRDLHFEYDSAVLAQSETSVIAELAAIIIRTAPKSITLIGHTDRRGSRDYNLELSKRRAQAVRDALVEWHDLDPALFRVAGRGEEELVSAGLTEADHARDRRVEIILDPGN